MLGHGTTAAFHVDDGGDGLPGLAPDDAGTWAALARARACSGTSATALEAGRGACALDPGRRAELVSAWRAEGWTELAAELARAP